MFKIINIFCIVVDPSVMCELRNNPHANENIAVPPPPCELSK